MDDNNLVSAFSINTTNVKTWHICNKADTDKHISQKQKRPYTVSPLNNNKRRKSPVRDSYNRKDGQTTRIRTAWAFAV